MMLLVDVLDRLELGMAQVARHPVRIGEIEHRIAGRSALHPLIDRREEAAAIDRRAGIGRRTTREQHHERRQVLVLGAEAVGHP